MLARKPHTYIILPYTFNVGNTVQLKNDLTDLPYDSNIKFASLHITNMYSNVPINEMMTTLNKLCATFAIEGRRINGPPKANRKKETR
jgi:hypothetical protein